jgi:hypothetical protein
MHRSIVAMIGFGVALAPHAAAADRSQGLPPPLPAKPAGFPPDRNECRILDIEFQPGLASGQSAKFNPQIVAWLEDTAGNYVETAYITYQTGTFGLGNRPGRFDLDSSPFWPYGRRITVFPVWSAKQPMRWPELGFQDGKDSHISHSMGDSSIEAHYCRPLRLDEFDATSCPSVSAYTDKGSFSPTNTVGYPPRNDLNPLPQDSPSVEMFDALNPFDAVSQPTPPGGINARINWAMPFGLAAGQYVLFVEVSKEFDMNATYNETSFPSPPPTEVDFNEYGAAYRGQPSVVYKVPVTLGDADTQSFTDTYIGYGDPDGLDGNIRPPDATITTNMPGSGGARLSLISLGGVTYRVHVTARHEIDFEPPVAPRRAEVAEVTGNSATLAFIAPGDDGRDGMVQGYEIRYRVGEEVTEANFASSTQITATVTPVASGQPQTITLDGLLPQTTYSIGIRAFDNCRNTSPVTVVEATTSERVSGQVDACFIATAAYGSVMANDVELLRRFRDSKLSKSVLGELAIETYYTFGPAVAGVVGESDLLRASARDLLTPLVTWVRTLRW